MVDIVGRWLLGNGGYGWIWWIRSTRLDGPGLLSFDLHHLPGRIEPMMREQKPRLKKPREQCKYWKKTPQGCFSGSKCRFRHDDPVFSPHDLNKICFFFQRGK